MIVGGSNVVVNTGFNTVDQLRPQYIVAFVVFS